MLKHIFLFILICLAIAAGAFFYLSRGGYCSPAGGRAFRPRTSTHCTTQGIYPYRKYRKGGWLEGECKACCTEGADGRALCRRSSPPPIHDPPGQWRYTRCRNRQPQAGGRRTEETNVSTTVTNVQHYH